MARRFTKNRSTRTCCKLWKDTSTSDCQMLQPPSDASGEPVDLARKELDSALAELRRAVDGYRGRRWPASDDPVRAVTLKVRRARPGKDQSATWSDRHLRHLAHRAVVLLRRALEPVSDFVKSVFRR